MENAVVFGFLEIEEELVSWSKICNSFFPNWIKSKKYVVLIHDVNQPLPIRYKMPGGTKEESEGHIQCLKREFTEEIGVEVSVSLEKKEDTHFQEKNDHDFITCRVNQVGGKLEVKDCKSIILCSHSKIRKMIEMKMILPYHARALEYFLEHST